MLTSGFLLVSGKRKVEVGLENKRKTPRRARGNNCNPRCTTAKGTEGRMRIRREDLK